MTDTAFNWLHKLLGRLEKSALSVEREQNLSNGVKLLQVAASDWIRLVQHLQVQDCRFAGLWASQTDEGFELNSCFARNGDFLLCRTQLGADAPAVGSVAGLYPAAARFERHTRDLLGIQFNDLNDTRRWVRHQAWAEDEFPLRADFNDQRGQKATPADSDYPFVQVTGNAVYEIPVGPVHAGIIEPGHFRFQAVGETVLNLEERLGYTHKGVEKIAQGRDAFDLAKLAARVSGDTTVAHTWAACQAMERATDLSVPERGLFLRAILCERERVANHLGDIGAVCNDVGFAFAQMQFSRLREAWLRRNKALFGSRLLMDLIIPGGCNVDIDEQDVAAMLVELRDLKSEIYRLLRILEKNQSLRDRLFETGRLSHERAQSLGCLGYVGRASGLDLDLRRDAPYAPYDQISVERCLQQAGDVAARVIQRAQEIYASLTAQQQLLDKLPHGPVARPWAEPAQACEGLGMIEGWRGEIVCYLRLNAEGRVERFFPRDPSWFNWPALELLIDGNIVPDFPVCNKSVNGSYSGHDL